ncbi:MAG: type VI secretion system baseplate subunit TssG [Pseudomonadota bacterium]|nr:type VI secretion system baseplate subunit TssG [Pseudomonadota bacterium]
METKNRLIPSTVNEELEKAGDYAFFQLNALLQQFRTVYNKANDKPVDIRYRALASLGFPASDIAGGRWLEQADREFIELTVSFMGLYGPASPLPVYYTERVLHSNDPQHPSRDLMDMFNHRLISLMQVCWEKYRYYIQYGVDGRDHYSRWLLSLAGVDQPLLRQQSRLKWHRLLPFAGVLAGANGGADFMSKVIARYFRLPSVEFEPWAVRTVAVPAGQCNAMGMRNASLGSDLVMGDSIQDCMGKFLIHLKGLAQDQYERFLPDGDGFDELIELLQLLMSDPYEYELLLHVEGERAAGSGDSLGGALGWNLALGGPEGARSPEPVRICVTDYRSI